MSALKTMAEIQSMAAGDAKLANDALMDRAKVLTEQFRAITEREKVKADGRKAESGDRGGSE
jgi:hypothetical protein